MGAFQAPHTLGFRALSEKRKGAQFSQWHFIQWTARREREERETTSREPWLERSLTRSLEGTFIVMERKKEEFPVDIIETHVGRERGWSVAEGRVPSGGRGAALLGGSDQWRLSLVPRPRETSLFLFSLDETP